MCLRAFGAGNPGVPGAEVPRVPGKAAWPVLGELIAQGARIALVVSAGTRDVLEIAAQMAPDGTLTIERGERSFAPNERVMFLKNERELGVKNGTLGTRAGN